MTVDVRESLAPRWERETPELLQVLLESIEDYAIYALDPEGVVVTWNPGAEATKGYAASEILGKHVATFYTPEDVAAGRPERDLAIAMADGSFQDEGWRVRKDGSLFWASVLVTAMRAEDGRLIGFGKVTRDLTERRRSDDLLRDSEERFRLLVNSVADYAIFLLDVDGVVSSWNLGAERLKGYPADEIIGRHFSIFYTDDDRRHGVPKQLLGQALRDGRVEREGWRVRRDGTLFWASVVITALRAADGTHRGFAKVTKDLTDRKRNEDALRGVLERERAAAERLREIDRLRTTVFELVAHDLRSPLGVIEQLAHLLATGWESMPDDTRSDYLHRIGARAVAMGELVNDLLDVVRIDAGELDVKHERFELEPVVSRAIEDVFAGPNETRVRARVDTDAHAWGDARRTRQVVTNLLSNAAKFSPATEPIDVVVERSRDEIRIAISDRGPGIPIDEQHLLFQRFTRLSTARETRGSGIGLFLAKSLVELQGGHISVVSAPDEGSTFEFRLRAG